MNDFLDIRVNALIILCGENTKVISISKMASASDGLCHNDPNFAVICNFLDRYGDLLGFKEISYADLQSWIEDSTRGVFNSRVITCLFFVYWSCNRKTSRIQTPEFKHMHLYKTFANYWFQRSNLPV